MGIYINDVDMPKQDEILQIRIYGDGKVSRVYDIECQQIGTAIESTKETSMTRDEAIKVLIHLREIIKEIPKALCKLPNVEERKRENIIALRMAIESLQVDAEWIPCSERLPKIVEQVLCCDSQSRVFTSALTEIASNGMTFFGQHCKVIAWMPLPKPYREDGE